MCIRDRPHYLCEDLDALNKAIQAKETELNAQGITAHLRHEVRGIDAAARKVTVCDLATGRVFDDHYDKLVLATGSSNRVPQVPGSDRVGVQTLQSVEDLILLKEFVRTPYVRDIVILGGSWAGLEIAKSFLKLGRNVRTVSYTHLAELQKRSRQVPVGISVRHIHLTRADVDKLFGYGYQLTPKKALSW